MNDQTITSTYQSLKNVDLERQVLGTFTYSLNKLEDVIPIVELLDVQDFYDLTHQYIYKTILGMIDTGKAIDIVSLSDELQKNRKEGDPDVKTSGLIELMENAFITTYHSLQSTRRLKTLSIGRQAIAIFSDTMTRLPKVEDPAELLANADSRLLDLLSGVREKRPTDVQGILAEVLEEIRKNAEQVQAGGTIGFDTGFEDLDNKLGGIIPSQVWVIGAYTGVGKSHFANQIILNMLRKHKDARVVLFSTEMDYKSIMERFLANISEFSALRFKKGLLTKEQFEAKNKAIEEMKTYQDRFFIYDNCYTLEELKLKCKKERITNKVNVIFLDFIQNLRTGGDIYERMSKAAIELQAMAKELGVAVVILSQISQEGQRAGSESNVISYKGAGELGAIADVALWLDPMKEQLTSYKQITVKVRKARHAESNWEMMLLFDGAGGGRMWQA